MNVYAHQRDSFDEQAARIGEPFAVPAAIAVQNAQVLAQAKRLAAQLQNALTNRASIDYAIGIVMSRVGCGPQEAVDRLQNLSQRENQKLHSIAARVVADAVRRARASSPELAGTSPRDCSVRRGHRRAGRSVGVLTPFRVGTRPASGVQPMVTATCRTRPGTHEHAIGTPENPSWISP